MRSEWLLRFRRLSARSDFSEHCADSVPSAGSSTIISDARDRSTVQRANGPKNTIGTQHSEDPGGEDSPSAQVEIPVAAPARWRDLYEERSAIHQYDGHYSRAVAEALAWGAIQTRWHVEHGERVSRDLCAGCRRPIGTGKVLDLIEGNRVHANDENACLTQHGERWRAAATRALLAFGLRPPIGVALTEHWGAEVPAHVN